MDRLRARWRLWRWRGPWNDEARVLSLRVRVGRLLDEPQEITHTVYVTSPAEAERVRTAALKAGYAVETERVGPPEAPEWELTVARWALPTLYVIREQRAFLEDLVDDYDGWLVTSLYADEDEDWARRQANRLEASAGPVRMPVRPYRRPPRWWQRRRTP
ncbi:ribonuclease E inhibitor RraB [Solirubrobacter taibaiensis]|nr:ribonuclease E inhibitor RraB [Solirubrobacter taibaiensis]